MYATTKAGGMCFAFPDVCKVPASPSPIPVPLPNIAQCADATASTCSQKTKIGNKVVLVASSEIGRSSGDEAGSLKGIVSGTNTGKAVFRTSVGKVKIEGAAIVRHLASTAQNGSNANAPAGTHVTPSQTKVLILG